MTLKPATTIEIADRKLLSDNWYHLYKYSFWQEDGRGGRSLQHREAYDRGNGAAILPWDPVRQTVLLVRQFRLPAYINGSADGMLIEACAGLLDGQDPDTAIRREAEEETGYRLRHVEKVGQAWMSPGSVTEIVYFYLAEYSPEDIISAGGGVEGEESIEVLELPLSTALAWSEDGRIADGKTLILLAKLSARLETRRAGLPGDGPRELKSS